MPELIWNPDWDTGLPLVDRQHHELFAMVQAMFNELHRGKESDLREMLAFLVTYVDFHFATEEQAMLQSGYPALARHKEVHDSMRARVATLQSSRITDGVLDFVVDWLIAHIDGEDRGMAAFLRTRTRPRGTLPAKEFKRPGPLPRDTGKPRG